MSQYKNGLRRALLILCSYAGFFLVYGLLLREPYHQNALVLLLSALVVTLASVDARWWVVFVSCVGLALFDALLAWALSHVVGLDSPTSGIRLLRNAVASGALTGILCSLLAWRLRARRSAAAPTNSGAPAA
jgi:hypothetical protein